MLQHEKDESHLHSKFNALQKFKIIIFSSFSQKFPNVALYHRGRESDIVKVKKVISQVNVSLFVGPGEFLRTFDVWNFQKPARSCLPSFLLPVNNLLRRYQKFKQTGGLEK